MLNLEALPFDLCLHPHPDSHHRADQSWLQRWVPGSSTANSGSHPAAAYHILQRGQAGEKRGHYKTPLFIYLFMFTCHINILQRDHLQTSQQPSESSLG